MWKTIGTVNPQQPKHNKSREESPLQPFAHNSKLKLNESQLSGETSPRFLNEYFGKKKKEQYMLQRVLSHKNIQNRPAVSPPSSLRELNSPKSKMDALQTIGVNEYEMSSLKELQKSTLETPADPRSASNKMSKQKEQYLKRELFSIKEQQQKLRTEVKAELQNLNKDMSNFKTQMLQKITIHQKQLQQSKNQSIDASLLARVQHQSLKFNAKMANLDQRKQHIRQKYKR